MQEPVFSSDSNFAYQIASRSLQRFHLDQLSFDAVEYLTNRLLSAVNHSPPISIADILKPHIDCDSNMLSVINDVYVELRNSLEIDDETRAKFSTVFRVWRPGRRREYCPVNRLINSRGQECKKEYMQVAQIRYIKKTLKQLTANRLIRSIDPMNQNHKVWFDRLTLIFQTYQRSLNLSTFNAPPLSQFRCFNSEYRRLFFKIDGMRQFHYAYTDFKFLRSPKELCNIFELKCCRLMNHTDECESLWKEVYDYIKFEMLVELGYSRKDLEEEAQAC